MPRVTDIYNDFLAGELSPRMAARTDLAIYRSGCETLENFYVMAHGGVTKRPGTEYIATAGDGDNPVRLIPFQYSTTQVYVLELGEYYMRFFTNGGQLYTAAVSAGGVPVEISTPWAASDIFELKFVQSADVVYFTHPDYTSRKLIRNSNISWTLSEINFYGGPFYDENSDQEVKIKLCSCTGTTTLSADDVITNGTFDSSLSSWERVTGEASQIDGKMRMDRDSRVEQAVDVNSDWDWDLTFDLENGSVDVVLSYEASGSTYTTVSTETSGSVSVTVSPSADDAYIGFYSNDDPVYIDNVQLRPKIWSSDHVGAYWKIRGSEISTLSASAEDTWSEALEVDEGDTVIISLNGTWDATVTLQRSFDDGTTWYDYVTYDANTTVTYTETEERVHYRIGVATGDYTSGMVSGNLTHPDQYGYVEIDTFTKSTQVIGTVIKEIPDASSTYKWSEGAFSDHNGHPSCCAFYENRLLFAGTEDRPQTIWGSQTDDYENFENKNNDDNESYSFTLVSNDVNTIRWMTDVEVLICGTQGGEWRFGYTDSATTPSNVTAKKQTGDGSANIQPLVFGHRIVYVQRGATKVRRLSYDYRSESWQSPELSSRAEHLLTNGIVDIAYASQPDSQIFFVRNDGNMVVLTYEPLQEEIIAFSKYTTEGEFESISIVPGSDRDEVWVVVKRTIDGTDYRYIEQFQTTEWADVEDGYYVDSALIGTWDTPVTSAGNLSHLEGETVYILADGAVHAEKTVTDGTITFDYGVSKAIVGLPYTAKLETMEIAVGAQAGTSLSKFKIVHQVDIKFLNTLEAQVGYSSDNTDVVAFRITSDTLGSAPDLFSGDKEIQFNTGYEKNHTIWVVHDKPLPCTVLAIMPVITTHDF